MHSTDAPGTPALNDPLQTGAEVVVTQIAQRHHDLFEPAGWSVYRASVLRYGEKLFREAKFTAADRSADGAGEEISSADVERSVVRVETRMAHFRRMPWVFGLIQQTAALFIGIASKYALEAQTQTFGVAAILFLILIWMVCKAFEVQAEVQR